MGREKSGDFVLSPSAAAAGLCADCRHRRLQRGARSLFLRCGRAARDPAYPRYPRLPVLLCAGYEPDPAPDGAPG